MKQKRFKGKMREFSEAEVEAQKECAITFGLELESILSANLEEEITIDYSTVLSALDNANLKLVWVKNKTDNVVSAAFMESITSDMEMPNRED